MSSAKKTPKVSVITPTYNRADLLKRSIDSVLAQSFSDFELILIDDGSTDETQGVLARYKDMRIKVVRFEQNCGIGAARYEGVCQAAGEWVSFLDADDLWHPGKLACDMSILEQHPEIDLLFDNYRNINYMDQVDQSGFDQARLAFERLKTTELEDGVFQINSGLAEALLTANLIGTASIITVHRAVFDKVGNFNPVLSGPEDFEFLWRATLAGIIFAYQTRVLVERHKDSGSITARTRSFAPQLLFAFDLCEANLQRYARNELLMPLNHARGRTWLGLIQACALEGRRGEAWNAFRNNLHYGFSVEACLYLIAALAGPQAIALAKRFRMRGKTHPANG